MPLSKLLRVEYAGYLLPVVFILLSVLSTSFMKERFDSSQDKTKQSHYLTMTSKAAPVKKKIATPAPVVHYLKKK